ncbi:unnamed protein product [Caenorhabditis angaria]|uniref:Sugar transporter SWEET n=1 Tax=Caenorhabditis angaria TaxID=860376 RepID=A0A9P1IG78_9PELO|nr:unnamed protein product [Caenorhabditis angaria]
MGGGFGDVILPYLSMTALASTVGFFLCGTQICYRIHQRGTTDGTSPAPFLMGFISCSFFIQYGFLKQDAIIYSTNAIGAFLQGVYLIYFWSKTRNTRTLNKILLIEICLISTLVLYCKYSGESRENLIFQIGNICIFSNILSVGAPLMDIGTVVSTKSSESLPFPLCFASFVVCLQWFGYGMIIEDMVIIVPNFIATIISILQLSLFLIYPAPSKKYEKLSQI